MGGIAIAIFASSSLYDSISRDGGSVFWSLVLEIIEEFELPRRLSEAMRDSAIGRQGRGESMR